MQPNPLAQSDKKRFRADAIARRVVTLFGLLVLAMFFLLVMHILSNAWPLLNKPDLNFEEKFDVVNAKDTMSMFTLSDSIILLSQGDCEVQLHEVESTKLLQIARFAHPCSSELVRMPKGAEGKAHYALIRSDGVVELFAFTQASSRVRRELTGSFVIPDYADLATQGESHSLDWNLELYQQNLVLYTQLDNNKYISIWTVLNSLEPATRLMFDAPKVFVPLVRFGQAVLADADGVHLVNRLGERQQTFLQANLDVLKVLVSPNQRSIYFNIDAIETQVWQNANLEGVFTFVPAGVLTGLPSGTLTAIEFDRQTLVAFAVDEVGHIHIFNSATHEVVKTHSFEVSPEYLHWHNNTLYVLAENKMYTYSLENTAGITTWKSLFSPVQYSGYTQAEYIWQTSQSANYAEPKFSLVPLIIGSLKASVLALLVAIPLALGAAIYTAYFASSNIRNWVKPSIEMVEAIPSVIIGFVAAVWLAPFAERSLLALLILLICTPLIVILLAFLHGVFKQTSMYHKVKKYYLALVSLAVVVLIVLIFESSMLLQVAVMANGDSWLGQLLAGLTITKTTVVVALALGIAVAPTIYSLVDDALFEVPDGVKQASFALGATELQTLTKVVLVVALPSIISAIMLGLGRAFGETMIVLMVTGNTPVADWDLLSGLRALTSNLTIELQEASVGTAQYHILFLTAAILFAFTFAINTIAALLKRRLQAGDQHV